MSYVLVKDMRFYGIISLLAVVLCSWSDHPVKKDQETDQRMWEIVMEMDEEAEDDCVLQLDIDEKLKIGDEYENS